MLTHVGRLFWEKTNIEKYVFISAKFHWGDKVNTLSAHTRCSTLNGRSATFGVLKIDTKSVLPLVYFGNFRLFVELSRLKKQICFHNRKLHNWTSKQKKAANAFFWTPYICAAHAKFLPIFAPNLINFCPICSFLLKTHIFLLKIERLAVWAHSDSSSLLSHSHCISNSKYSELKSFFETCWPL